MVRDSDICSSLSKKYEHYEYYCKIKSKPIILKECDNCKYYYSRKESKKL